MIFVLPRVLKKKISQVDMHKQTEKKNILVIPKHYKQNKQKSTFTEQTFTGYSASFDQERPQ